MPKPQAPTPEVLETRPVLDTRPAMRATTTAMAPSDQRPVVPKVVKIERQVAAKPAAVTSDASPVEATKTEVAKTDLNIPMPRPAPQRAAAPPAAPVLASVEPTAPAPEVKNVEPPRFDAVAPETPKRATRQETRQEKQKPKVAAVPPAAPIAVSKPAAAPVAASKPAAVAAAPAESAEKPAAPSGEGKSLWSAFTNELSAARPGANAAPARQQTAAAPAAEPAPSRKSKKSAKESEPFNLLTYVKKKITPDAKPEKKKTPQT
jgi:hypothetical protein